MARAQVRRAVHVRVLRGRRGHGARRHRACLLRRPAAPAVPSGCDVAEIPRARHRCGPRRSGAERSGVLEPSAPAVHEHVRGACSLGSCDASGVKPASHLKVMLGRQPRGVWQRRHGPLRREPCPRMAVLAAPHPPLLARWPLGLVRLAAGLLTSLLLAATARVVVCPVACARRGRRARPASWPLPAAELALRDDGVVRQGLRGDVRRFRPSGNRCGGALPLLLACRFHSEPCLSFRCVSDSGSRPQQATSATSRGAGWAVGRAVARPGGLPSGMTCRRSRSWLSCNKALGVHVAGVGGRATHARLRKAPRGPPLRGGEPRRSMGRAILRSGWSDGRGSFSLGSANPACAVTRRREGLARTRPALLHRPAVPRRGVARGSRVAARRGEKWWLAE